MSVFTYIVLGIIATLVLCILGLLAFMYRVYRTDGLWWYGKLGHDQKLTKVPCKECDGYGIQVLHEGKIENLKPHTRDRKKGVWAWGAPLGNKQACLQCKGHGFNWAPATKNNTHQYRVK